MVLYSRANRYKLIYRTSFFVAFYRTLQWVRGASPIIIHINLDKVLKFLVEDTHYRNQFETGTSGGSMDIQARKSWEVRALKFVFTYCADKYKIKSTEYGLSKFVFCLCLESLCIQLLCFLVLAMIPAKML